MPTFHLIDTDGNQIGEVDGKTASRLISAGAMLLEGNIYLPQKPKDMEIISSVIATIKKAKNTNELSIQLMSPGGKRLILSEDQFKNIFGFDWSPDIKTYSDAVNEKSKADKTINKSSNIEIGKPAGKQSNQTFSSNQKKQISTARHESKKNPQKRTSNKIQVQKYPLFGTNNEFLGYFSIQDMSRKGLIGKYELHNNQWIDKQAYTSALKAYEDRFTKQIRRQYGITLDAAFNDVPPRKQHKKQEMTTEQKKKWSESIQEYKREKIQRIQKASEDKNAREAKGSLAESGTSSDKKTPGQKRQPSNKAKAKNNKNSKNEKSGPNKTEQQALQNKLLEDLSEIRSIIGAKEAKYALFDNRYNTAKLAIRDVKENPQRYLDHSLDRLVYEIVNKEIKPSTLGRQFGKKSDVDLLGLLAYQAVIRGTNKGAKAVDHDDAPILVKEMHDQLAIKPFQNWAHESKPENITGAVIADAILKNDIDVLEFDKKCYELGKQYESLADRLPYDPLVVVIKGFKGTPAVGMTIASNNLLTVCIGLDNDNAKYEALRLVGFFNDAPRSETISDPSKISNDTHKPATSNTTKKVYNDIHTIRISKSPSRNLGGHHASPEPTVVRAHWHSYWEGSGENKKLVPHWVRQYEKGKGPRRGVIIHKVTI